MTIMLLWSPPTLLHFGHLILRVIAGPLSLGG